MANKSETSQIGAIPKAQQAQSFQNWLRTFSMKNSPKRFETPKRCLSCSENASIQKFGC